MRTSPGRRPTAGNLSDLGLALSGWIALAVTALPAAAPLRILPVSCFLLLCPGAATVRAATPGPRKRDNRSRALANALLSVAVSLSLGALVAGAFFLPGRFSGPGALGVLAALTTLLTLLAQLGPGIRRRAARAGPHQEAEYGTTGAGQPPECDVARTRPPVPRSPRSPRSPLARRAGQAAAVGLLLMAAACGGRGPTAPPPVPTPTKASTAPSGVPSPAATTVGPAAPGPWHQVFSDDFNGSTLDPASWTPCYDWNLGGCTNSGTGEVEWYLPGQVTVGGGLMTLTATRAQTVGSDGGSYPWRSGMISTGRDSWNATPRRTFTHGYFEARVQVPAEPGMFPAFWLMPDSKATPPEMDIVEFIGGTRTAIMTVHWTGPDGGDIHTGRHYHGPDFAAGFHVFALDWEQNSLAWYIDGVFQLKVTDHVPQVPMEMLFTLAVGFPAAPPATVGSAQMKVDWVRVWQH